MTQQGLLPREVVKYRYLNNEPLYYVQMVSSKKYEVKKVNPNDDSWIFADHNKGLFVFDNFFYAWAFSCQITERNSK